MGSGKKVDNSMLTEKVNLRLAVLDKIKKAEIKVLDAFGGNGVVWDETKKKTKQKISTLRIDHRDDLDGVYLKGDNLKYLKGLDLSKFDIIDLDAYGSPYQQLKIVLESGYKGHVVCTLIETHLGGQFKEMLIEIGYTAAMIEKVPVLFAKHGREKMFAWLDQKGIEEVEGYFFNRDSYSRRSYFAFEIKGE